MVQIAKSAFFEVPVRWFELEIPRARTGFVRSNPAMESLENGKRNSSQESGEDEHLASEDPSSRHVGQILSEVA